MWWRDENEVVAGWSRENSANQKLPLGRSHKFEVQLETLIRTLPDSLNTRAYSCLTKKAKNKKIRGAVRNFWYRKKKQIQVFAELNRGFQASPGTPGSGRRPSMCEKPGG